MKSEISVIEIVIASVDITAIDFNFSFYSLLLPLLDCAYHRMIMFISFGGGRMVLYCSGSCKRQLKEGPIFLEMLNN